MYKINGHKLLQYPGELEELCAIFFNENVKSYLEIGCKFGGSLWKVGTSLLKGSRIVGVDLMEYGDPTGHLKDSAAHLSQAGYQVQLIKGDSANKNIVRHVEKLGPFDACMIDGNHSLAYVRQDWENYGPMCRLVAFHDINYYRPAGDPDILKHKPPIEVPKFWNEIKVGYRHIEIKKDRRDNGIGVLWR